MNEDVFVAIDFETGDEKRDSACSVAIVRVEGVQIVESRVSLIKPPQRMDRRNIEVHGLRDADVARAGTFADVWPAFAPMLAGAGVIVAHNVPFDRSVLRACCEAAGLPVPSHPWADTVTLAKAKWREWMGYKLDQCCQRLGIALAHHEAQSDAEAAAELYLRTRDLQLVGRRTGTAKTATASPTTPFTHAVPGVPTGPAWGGFVRALVAATPLPAVRQAAPTPRPEVPFGTVELLPSEFSSAAEACEFGRKAALGRASLPVGLRDDWTEAAIQGGYQAVQHERDVERLRQLLGFSREELALVLEGLRAGDVAGPGLARRPTVHPLTCGACGTKSLTDEGRGPCDRCGWSRASATVPSASIEERAA